MKAMIKNKKGITLIALIITIIVLLILAMVSINIAMNQGLIIQTKTATETYQAGTEKEIIGIAYNEYKIKENDELYIEDAIVKGNDIIGWEITFNQTQNKYFLSPDGLIGEKISFETWDGTSRERPNITEDNNWHIENGSQLKYLADFVNDKLTQEEKGELEITSETIIYLENNIDLGAEFDDNGTIISGNYWEPIGMSKTAPFVGIFDGNNKVIKRMCVNINENFGGLFGNSNTVKNLIIQDSYVKSLNCSGGIVGALRGGSIENCTNINTKVIAIEKTAGGIVGQSVDGNEIKKCTNTGKIESSYMTGGITGNNKIDIIDCYNSGNISGKKYCGGIYAYSAADSIVSNCENSGEVIGTQYVAGIIGYNSKNITITDSYNFGNIYSETTENPGDYNCAGGISCALGSGIIKNCKNTGNVTCKTGSKWNRSGGICGWAGSSNGEAIISNCSNTGNILAEGYSTYMTVAGGIYGDSDDDINVEKCYNSGRIFGKNAQYIYIGGIIGRYQQSGNFNLKNCYSKGTIKEENYTKFIRKGSIVGNISTIDEKKTSNLFYMKSDTSLGALDSLDYEEQNVKEIDNNFDSLEEFIKWIK